MTEYYCPEHKYNPPESSGFCFCPRCEFPEEMARADKEASEATAEQYFLHGRDLSEREVQTGIKDKLEEAGWYVRSFSSDRRVQGQWEGWPDLAAFKADHTLLLECKATKRGSLRDKQKEFAARLETEEGPHLKRLTVRHPIEIEDWLIPGKGAWKS